MIHAITKVGNSGHIAGTLFKTGLSAKDLFGRNAPPINKQQISDLQQKCGTKSPPSDGSGGGAGGGNSGGASGGGFNGGFGGGYIFVIPVYDCTSVSDSATGTGFGGCELIGYRPL